jgi:hypothetical protein
LPQAGSQNCRKQPDLLPRAIAARGCLSTLFKGAIPMPIRKIDKPSAVTPTVPVAPRKRIRPIEPQEVTPPGDESPVPDTDASDTTEAAPKPPGEFEVGYGKPPAEYRFAKGRSGNPNGRPKGARGLNTMVREILLARIPVRTAKGVKRMTRLDAMLHKQTELAMKGDHRAIVQLLKVYAAAVPDTAPEHGSAQDESLSLTDEAILARFRAQILSNQGDDQ